ncbi:MAG: protein kinase [Verrucomicrobiota bacterium]
MPESTESTREQDPETLLRRNSEGATLRGVTGSESGIRDDAPVVAVPDHELLCCVGRGSYGQVWLARNVMGTYRAVKIVERASFQNARPFDREFNGILKFEPLSRAHPGMVDILQVGRTPNCFYYVMELADDVATGQQIDPLHYTPKTLRTELDAHGRLPFERCLQLALALTDALGHLHAHGLIHRDIKPSNIIFVHEQPKLADIGLVAEQSDAKSFVGTEGFIPPEGPGTAQADLYSLGKVLYELATGKDRHDFPELPTFTDDGSTSDAGLIELNAVILKACQPDPKQRYASVAAMRDDLLLLQGGKSVKRSQALERRLAWARRITALSALIILGTIVALLFFQRQAQQEAAQARRESALRSRAEASELAARRNLYSADMNLAFRALDEGNRGQVVQKLEDWRPLSGEPDLRGWEWRYLFEQCRGDELATLGGHSNTVDVVQFLPDGQTLAAITWDGVVELWDTATRTLKASTAFGTRLDGLSVSPDGLRIAVSQHEGGIRLLDAGTLEVRFQIETGQTADMVRFSPDGRLLAWAGTEGTVVVYDPEGKREIRRFETYRMQHRGWKWPLSFSPDGRLLVFGRVPPEMSTSWATELAVWDLRDDKEIVHWGSPKGGILEAEFSPDGKRVAAGFIDEPGRGGRLVVWDLSQAAPIFDQILDSFWVGCVSFSPDGTLLAAACRGQNLQLFDTSTWQRIATFEGHDSEVYWVAFSPDNRVLASGSKDRKIKLWDSRLHPSHGIVWDIASHDVGSLLLGGDGVRLLNLEPRQNFGRILNSLTFEFIGPAFDLREDFNSLRLSPDGRFVALGRTNGMVDLWDVTTGRLGTVISQANRGLGVLCFSPGSDRLAVFGPTNQILVWEVNSRTLLSTFSRRPGVIMTAAFSPNANILAIGFDEGSVQVCELSRLEFAEFRTGHPDHIAGIKFSHDGRSMATTGLDGTIRLWSSTDWRLMATLSGQLTGFKSMAFTPDDRRLAAGGEGGIRLWDMSQIQPREVGMLRTPGVVVMQLAFLKDGNTLVSVDNQAVRVWRAPTLSEMDHYSISK